MHIGIDASRLAVGRRTGTENYAYQVTRRLVQNRQHRFTLYFNQHPALQIRGLELGDNVKIKAMPFPRLWTHARLSLEMQLHPPDVLFVPAHVLPIVHPVRSVVTVHDLGYLYHPEAHTKANRRYLNWSTRYNANAAQQVIAVSQATATDLTRHYGTPPDKIKVVHHGFDREYYQPHQDGEEIARIRIRYNIQPGPYLFYVGTIQPRKNLVRLAQAFANLVQDESFDYPARQQLQLIIGGKTGWLSNEVVKSIEAINLPHQIKFIGYVSDDDLAVLYNGAEAFVFPSLYEGFGLPIIEAMACGTPVICSNAGSLPEVAGDAALLHHPLDTHAIKWQMQRLLTHPDLADQLSQRGLVQAARFSWDTCAAETLAILEKF